MGILGYSLTSPYGHLIDIMQTPLYYGQFVWSQKCQKSWYILYLYNTDTSVKQTLNSVPLVSILKEVWLYYFGGIKDHKGVKSFVIWVFIGQFTVIQN